MARYWLTPTANGHYQRAVYDTRQRWGPVQSNKYRAALRAGFQQIADEHTSFNSPHREGLAEGTGFTLQLVAHRYVAFQPYRDDVIIAGVFHESMDIPERLRQLQAMTRNEIRAIRREIGTIRRRRCSESLHKC